MTISKHSIHQSAEVVEDIDLDGIDPKAAWHAFTAAWQRYSSASVSFRSLPHREQRIMWTAKMANKWSSTRSALGTFLRSLSPNDRRKVWKQKKLVQASRDESHQLWLVVLYEREKDRLRASTEKGKARRARYDAKIADDPIRQAKIREYKARHRAKIKANKKPTLRIVK